MKKNFKYKKLYSNPKWHAFREKVFLYHGRICMVCEIDFAITFQVNHPYYIEGKKTHEYQIEEMEVLCVGCHAREHNILEPNSGWELIEVEDLGDLIGLCDRGINFKAKKKKICNTKKRSSQKKQNNAYFNIYENKGYFNITINTQNKTYFKLKDENKKYLNFKKEEVYIIIFLYDNLNFYKTIDKNSILENFYNKEIKYFYNETNRVIKYSQ